MFGKRLEDDAALTIQELHKSNHTSFQINTCWNETQNWI